MGSSDNSEAIDFGLTLVVISLDLNLDSRELTFSTAVYQCSSYNFHHEEYITLFPLT